MVRKGATPAFPGQRGFVGGSMGDDAVILSGVESETAAASFYSTVHGAGRVMSRTEARGRFVKDPETGKRIRLPDVLKEHAGTVKIEHTLRPFAVIMAGADVFDPFKD